MPLQDSLVIEEELSLLGVWIHDPLDPEGTVASFPFGSAARDTSIDAMGAGSYFAGRTSPVVDYGEHEAEMVSVSIDVPHGETYRADLEKLEWFSRSKRSLWFRDNRGRAVFGVMAGFKHADAEWGSVASFTIERTHRDVTEVVV